VNLNTTLRQVIQMMMGSLEMNDASHIRYVWIVDDSSKPIGLITMADIANYFYISTLSVWY